MSSQEDEETRRHRPDKLYMEAMAARLEKMMAQNAETLRQEFKQSMDQILSKTQPEGDTSKGRKPTEKSRNEFDEYYYGNRSSSSHNSRRRHHSRAREGREPFQQHLGGLKLKIPPFHGKNDPDAYLDWEKKTELAFMSHGYSNQSKVKEAALSFHDYALNWWDQDVKIRNRTGEPHVMSWNEMKSIMRRRYAPRHYHGMLKQDYGNQEGIKGVEEKLAFQRKEPNQPLSIPQKSKKQKEDVKSSTMKELDEKILKILNAYNKSIKAKAKCALPSKSDKDALSFEFVKDTRDPSFEKSDFALENNQACDQLTLCKPVQPSMLECFSQVLKETSQEEVQESEPSKATDLKQQTFSVLKPIKSNECPQEHCKEIDLVTKESNLFVLVSAEEEKRFGLENMKEFTVSKSVFDQLIPAFETLTLTTFLKQKSLLIDEISESNASYELCKPVLKEHVFVKSFAKFSKLISLPTRALLVPDSVKDFWCSNLILDCDKVFKFHKKHSEFDTNVSRKEILFDCFNRTFDVFLLVFVKANKGQVENEILNTWKGKLIFKENGKELQTNCEWSGLKTIKFKWKDKEEMTCQLIKEKFSNTLLVLTLSDYFKTPELEYHAIGKGIGNVLMQNQKSVVIFYERDGGQLNLQSVLEKGFKVIQDHFLWPHKKKGDVERRYQMYIICKLTNTQPHGLHHSVPIPLHSWNEVAIGFVEFPKIKMDTDFNFVIMNKFSKLFHFFYFQKSINTLHHAHLIFESVRHLNSFLKIKLVLFDAFHEFETSLNNPNFTINFASCPRISDFNEAFKQFRTESTFVWYKTFSRMKQLLKFVCCTFIWFNELRKHVESVLNVLDQESFFENHYNLLNNSCHTFDVFSLVLLKSLKKQDSFQKKANKSNKSRTIQFGFRNWKYLRKFILEPDPSQVFKHIKNKDHLTYLQGKSSRGKSLNVTNFVPFIADKADLRSNPFEEGGDDVIMESLEHGTDMTMERSDHGAKEQLVPEDNGAKEQLVAEENGAKEETALHVPVGPMTRSKMKLFNQAISALLIQAESNLSNIAYPTTLVVIQAS